MRKIILILLFLSFHSIISHAVIDTKSYVNNMSIDKYSYNFESDYFIFGSRYYAVVEYSITNFDEEGKYIIVSFKNSENKTLETKRIYLGTKSIYSGREYVRIGTFFYVMWGKEEERIIMDIKEDEQ